MSLPRALLVAAVIAVVAGVAVAAASHGDGTSCYRGCSGHGECRQYMCHCHVGYHGEDCSIAYVDDGAPVLPVLSAGHFNVTAKQHAQLVKSSRRAKSGAQSLLVLGYSSPACARCIVFEREYALLADDLKAMNVRTSAACIAYMCVCVVAVWDGVVSPRPRAWDAHSALRRLP